MDLLETLKKGLDEGLSVEREKTHGGETHFEGVKAELRFEAMLCFSNWSLIAGI